MYVVANFEKFFVDHPELAAIEEGVMKDVKASADRDFVVGAIEPGVVFPGYIARQFELEATTNVEHIQLARVAMAQRREPPVSVS